jgi:hypothetical protein
MTSKLKLKLKQSHYIPQRRVGGDSSYPFSASALDGGEWSASRPGRALAPGKGPPVPIVQEAGWSPEPVWTQTRGKILSPLPRIEPRSSGRPARSQTLLTELPGSPKHNSHWDIMYGRYWRKPRKFCLRTEIRNGCLPNGSESPKPVLSTGLSVIIHWDKVALYHASCRIYFLRWFRRRSQNWRSHPYHPSPIRSLGAVIHFKY